MLSLRNSTRLALDSIASSYGQKLSKELYLRIAIMQPYFLPYAGYFRLLQATDLFVVYDCVQFTRRGWIHRNQLTNLENEAVWFTLPFTKAPQDIKINELSFANDAESRMQEQIRKFPLFTTKKYLESEFNPLMLQFSSSVTVYITQLLKAVCDSLAIPFNVVYSSELNLPPHLKGQERILAIANHFNADTYINAPGGRELYDEKTFSENGIQLQFLPPYNGSFQSILPRLMCEDTAALKNEILTQSYGIA